MLYLIKIQDDITIPVRSQQFHFIYIYIYISVLNTIPTYNQHIRSDITETLDCRKYCILENN